MAFGTVGVFFLASSAEHWFWGVVLGFTATHGAGLIRLASLPLLLRLGSVQAPSRLSHSEICRLCTNNCWNGLTVQTVAMFCIDGPVETFGELGR